MEISSPIAQPEALHPSLWRASQLGRANTKCIDSGYAALSMQLPGGGWPTGALTELMLQQAGIGELRLLAPALSKVASRKVIMLDPPHAPQALALPPLGLQPEHLVWVRTSRTADSLWAAEQVLRSGSCGALLLWQNHIRPESVRRLNLAAQQGETLCFVFRPIASAQDASAAPLRLSVRPASGGINVQIVKRRGPSTDQIIFLPMPIGPASRPVQRPQVETDCPTSRPVFARLGAPEMAR